MIQKCASSGKVLAHRSNLRLGRLGLMLRVASACALVLLGSCSKEEHPATGDTHSRLEHRPNILLILADDLGNNDLGAFGDGAAKTPDIDALANAGVRFRRHYAYATCRPARMALLSGISASRVAVPPHVRGITPELVTLPEALAAAGYTTYHIGKWHLGNVESAKPHNQGFQDWYGFLSALETRHGSLEKPGKSYIKPWLSGRDKAPAQREGHLTDILTEHALGKIREFAKGDRPWFINLWYLAPHRPISPHPRFRRVFPDTPEGRYLALVAQLDESVGRLMALLEELDISDETLVVFLSDNGGTNAFRDSNWPFYGKKTNFLEGGLRTPLILRLPGQLAPADVQDPVFIRDLMPTLLGFAGVPVPDSVEGRDIRPLLRGESVRAAPVYYWDFRTDGFGFFGVMDLEQGLLVNDNSFQRWDAGRSIFNPPSAIGEGLLKSYRDRYRQWSGEARRVELRAVAEADGSRQFSGDSYRRTPGFGGWTLQIPVSIGAGNRTRIVQPEQFGIDVDDTLIQVQLPGQAFQAAVPEASRGCQLLTLSTYYSWKDRANIASSARASLFLGETRLRSVEFEIWPDQVSDMLLPMSIAGTAAQPVVVNDILESELQRHYQLAISASAEQIDTRPDCSGRRSEDIQ